MTRRLPLVPTIVVAAAVATMIGLGIWQVQRAQWKERLLAQYAQADKLPPITWPTTALRKGELPLFRHATGVCLRPVGKRAVAGHNRAGESGYAHIVDCMTGIEGPGMSVEVGWSRDPNAQFRWDGGPVSGIIAPDRRSGMRLVAATAPPGLQASALPSTASISNNHRMYALTWFSFAVIAIVIYGLALKQRWRKEAAKP